MQRPAGQRPTSTFFDFAMRGTMHRRGEKPKPVASEFSGGAGERRPVRRAKPRSLEHPKTKLRGESLYRGILMIAFLKPDYRFTTNDFVKEYTAKGMKYGRKGGLISHSPGRNILSDILMPRGWVQQVGTGNRTAYALTEQARKRIAKWFKAHGFDPRHPEKVPLGPLIDAFAKDEAFTIPELEKPQAQPAPAAPAREMERVKPTVRIVEALRRAENAGLNEFQASLLAKVGAQSRLTLEGIADAMRILPGAAARELQALEIRGLVEKFKIREITYYRLAARGARKN